MAMDVNIVHIGHHTKKQTHTNTTPAAREHLRVSTRTVRAEYPGCGSMQAPRPRRPGSQDPASSLINEYRRLVHSQNPVDGYPPRPGVRARAVAGDRAVLC